MERFCDKSLVVFFFFVLFTTQSTTKMTTLDQKYSDLLKRNQDQPQLTSAQVYSRGIPWDSLRGAYISETELQMIKEYDNRAADKSSLIEGVRI